MFENVQTMVKNQLKNDLKQYGFKSRRFNFYRQVNGVLQGFKVYAYGHYTIRYNMFPLINVHGYDNYVFEGNEIAELTNPERNTFLEVIPYGYNVTEQDQINAWRNRYNIYVDFANQLVDEVYRYLLPLFNEYDSPEKHIGENRWTRFPLFYENYNQAQWCLQARCFDDAYVFIEKAINEQKKNSNDYFLRDMLTYKTFFDNNDLNALEKYLVEKESVTLKSFGLKK